MIYDPILKEAKEHQKEYKYLLEKGNFNKMLKALPDLHDAAFEKIDCLQCANCCKTTTPIFYMKDIERLAKYLRMKSADFIKQYLHIDEDRDYVLNVTPCPFLGSDNYCSVYESRPNACREYPHTNARKFHRLFDITIKNTAICPAVYEIVEKLKKVYK